MRPRDLLHLSASAIRRPELPLLVAVFLGSRLMIYALGFHYDVGLVNSAVQNVDPSLLKTHLLQSLWNLHGQPPLWNALIGLSLKAAPSHWPDLWHLAFLGLGLIEVLALFALLVELRVDRRAAAAIAAVFSVSPAVLLAENQFFYDYPTVVVVTLSGLAVVRCAARPSFARGSLVFACAAYAVLTRTLFQVWWMAAVLAILLVACRRHRRVILLSAALPVALVLGVYVKNWVMFGVPSTTSWTGMGLARVAVVGLPLSERRELVREGKLHSVSLVKPEAPLRAYEAVGIKPDPPTGIPLLDEATGPEVSRNLENKTYIRISRLYWKDDIWIIEHRPRAYVRAVGNGLDDFFTSSTVAWQGQGNEAEISSYDHWFTRIVYGRLGSGKVGLFLVAVYLLALGYGIAVAVRRLRPGCDAAVTTIAFAALTILYVTVTGNFAEVGENFRFRLALDPLALALCAVAARQGLRRLRRVSPQG